MEEGGERTGEDGRGRGWGGGEEGRGGELALKSRFDFKSLFRPLGIPYIAGRKREGMPFSGMMKHKLKFRKSMYNKITKKR